MMEIERLFWFPDHLSWSRPVTVINRLLLLSYTEEALEIFSS